MCIPVPLLDQQPLELEPAPLTEPQLKKRRGGHAAARTELLGDNPRERRAAIRSVPKKGTSSTPGGGVSDLLHSGGCPSNSDLPEEADVRPKSVGVTLVWGFGVDSSFLTLSLDGN